MTRPPTAPRSPLVLLAVGALLAVLGVILLAEPAPQPPPAPRPPAATSTPGGPGDRAPASTPTGSGSARARSADPTAEGPAGRPNALPVSGEGPRGDPAIQKAVRAAVPDDLPKETARVLAQLGRTVQVAEATGRGRHLWPTYFPPDQPVRAYTRVRIQAAAARADGPGRAAVHLVWAGADPAGTYRNGRPATLRFQHTPLAKKTTTTEGEAWTSWIPVR
ncbi:hypothetical protein ACFYVL_40230 [Streptomyces sp. NPDC004111]|uniref:hypothetical protein n=1 Tax=Streptomyces sp. NPDC004111 TaxID=3364690 RepID=UPI0036A503D8